MFDLIGCVFRFGNVVGPRQTHGVGFDFIRRLLEEPDRLTILGDGRQSKSYVHVSDVVEAVLLAAVTAPWPLSTYNVATGDYITVGEIAELAVEVCGLDPGRTEFVFTGGDRGWRGDVPVVRLNTESYPPPRMGQFHVEPSGTRAPRSSRCLRIFALDSSRDTTWSRSAPGGVPRPRRRAQPTHRARRAGPSLLCRSNSSSCTPRFHQPAAACARWGSCWWSSPTSPMSPAACWTSMTWMPSWRATTPDTSRRFVRLSPRRRRSLPVP